MIIISLTILPLKTFILSSCVAHMPDVDTEVSLGTTDEAQRLVSNGRQVTVSLNLGFAAQLVSPDPRDNNSLTVCDTRACGGQDFRLELEFDSSPAPAILEWVIRSNDRRNQLTLREGERRRGYSVGKYRSVRDTRHQDRSETQGEDRV